jgi:hypothetical protein
LEFLIRSSLARTLGWLAATALGAWATYTYLLKRPRNGRDWEDGFDLPAIPTVVGESLEIRRLRDFQTNGKGGLTRRYTTLTVDLDSIERVWFVMQPFPVMPFTDAGGAAHTYLVFDFADAPPIAVSIEARRQREDRYGMFGAVTNRYELAYVWSTEEDQTVRRVIDQGREVYMVPLSLPREWARQLLLGLARSTVELARQPRFYNAFVHNCTNELAQLSNQIRPHTIPLDPAWVMPSRSLQLLHRLGLIPTETTVDAVQARYRVTGHVRELWTVPNFSRRLRDPLLAKQEWST